MLAREGDEGLGGALGMGYESELGEAGAGQDVVYKGWEVEDPHLPDVPGPHAWVGVDEEGMFWAGTAAVVAEPDVVSACVGGR